MNQSSPFVIIAVTGSSDDAVRREALEAGVTDFLTKPLDAQETRARCRNLLALRHAQRSLADRAAWLAAEVRRATETIVTRERATVMRLAGGSGTEFDQDCVNAFLASWPAVCAVSERWPDDARQTRSAEHVST